MPEPITLELVDPDAVLRSDGRSELSRADLLRRAALSGGALIGGGVLLSGVPKAMAATKTDVAVLQFLLINESMEAAFYKQAANSSAIKGRAKAFAKQLAANERVHRNVVRKALGSAAPDVPEFDFKGIPDDQDKFLTTALALEDGDVAANNGAGPLVSKKLLAVAGQIVSVEARQAAWIRRIVYGNTTKTAARQPAPSPFDKPITLAQAKAAVKKTGFVQGDFR